MFTEQFKKEQAPRLERGVPPAIQSASRPLGNRRYRFTAINDGHEPNITSPRPGQVV